MTTTKNNDIFVAPKVDFDHTNYPYRMGSSPAFHKPYVFIPVNAQSYDPLTIGQPNDEKGKKMSGPTITEGKFWLGIATSIIGFLVIACSTSWVISNNINDKINQSRQELSGNIQTSKTELSSAIQSSKTELHIRLDRLEDKIDTNIKETSINLIKIQSLLERDNVKKESK
ncbi:hypothetical protein [Citrobacter koseri]|uniref:hypothetical protein n=1 Tax=Citrobacter koseri TaxID=545 RepID=UPI001E2DCB0B|nr:hypothetical protein [Citrobacter koseri]